MAKTQAGVIKDALAAKGREAELLKVNEKLARKVRDLADARDEALNKLDEVAQRIRQVAPELAQELDELNGIGRT